MFSGQHPHAVSMRTLLVVVALAVLSGCESPPVELEAVMAEPESAGVKPAPRPAPPPLMGAWDVTVVSASPSCDVAPLPVSVDLLGMGVARVTLDVGGELEEWEGWWIESTVAGWYLETWTTGGWYNEPGTVLRPVAGGLGWQGQWTLDRYEAGVAPCLMSVTLTR